MENASKFPSPTIITGISKEGTLYLIRHSLNPKQRDSSMQRVIGWPVILDTRYLIAVLCVGLPS